MVVTWNAAATIADCLGAVPADVPVTVIDNASTDGTADLVRQVRPSARLIVHDSNRGFAAAVNRGLAEAADTKFVLLLNPDAVLGEDALATLVAFADKRARAALVSALVVDRDGLPEKFAAGHEPSVSAVATHELGLRRVLPRRSLYAVPDASEPTEFDWVAGTCVLVRQEAAKAVGPLDEQYFLYCEDIDWSRRMREAGWEVWVAPAARAIHGRSASVNAAGEWVDDHRMGSLDRYFSARHEAASVTAFRTVRVIGSAVRAGLWTALGAVGRRPEMQARARQRRRDVRTNARLLRQAR